MWDYDGAYLTTIYFFEGMFLSPLKHHEMAFCLLILIFIAGF